VIVPLKDVIQCAYAVSHCHHKRRDRRNRKVYWAK